MRRPVAGWPPRWPARYWPSCWRCRRRRPRPPPPARRVSKTSPQRQPGRSPADGRVPPMPERVYTNRYEIVRHIARGGMAEVYLAHDRLLDRDVALKVLFPEFARDPSFVQRFRREAQAAANLNHPNIVAVYDWGEEDGTYFIVMEYVEGQTLREFIREHVRLGSEQAADIGADVAAALSFAHRGGVVHRDVTPGNILMTPNGQVKVTD